MVKILLNVSGKSTIKAEYTEMDISFFKLDLKNPRFNHTNLKSEKEFENEIWKEKDIGVLYNSILESKGISEPLFVRSDGTVIEGNRRVVCLRKLKELYANNENIFPSQGYKKIPTYILPDNVEPVDLDVLLARLHVSGKKEWKSLNQAEHIYNLRTKYSLTFEKIKDLIGMSKGKIHQKEWAFSKTKEFLKEYPKESISKYSFFEEAYKKRDIKEFIDTSIGQNQFFKWIVDRKFNDVGAIDVRKLATIINNPKIMTIFKNDGIKKAFTEYEKLNGKNDNFKIIQEATNLLEGLSEDELSRITNDQEKVKKLIILKEKIEKVIKK